MQKTLYSSAARTATPTAVTVQRGRYRGLKLVIDCTAIAATPSVTPKIEGVDSLSGKVWTIITGAAITATGTTVLTVYPGATASANVAVNDILPDQLKVTLTHGDSDSATYTAAIHLIP